MSGNIDVILAPIADVESGTMRQHIQAGIELKKDDDKGSHEKQVILQHLAASMLNPSEGIFTVMTDLNSRWHFYCFDQQRGKLYRLMPDTRGEAQFLLGHMHDRPDSTNVSLFPTDFLVRGTWGVFF
jgi:hypothetical protein